MRPLAVVLLLGAAALAGCRAKDSPAPPPSGERASAPAPASLLAELSLGNPKETWQRLRLLGGERAQALPSSLAVVLTTSLSLPAAAAGSLDEQLPMVGAVLSREGATRPDWVVGMHVLSGAELIASLTLGSSPRFRRDDVSPGLVRLLPAAAGAELEVALGVSGNYLLLATGAEALSEAGRFVAESVSERARSEPGLALRVGGGVAQGKLVSALREGWRVRRQALLGRAEQERLSKGRKADFAEPAALLGGVDSTVESLFDVLQSAKELRLSLTPHSERLSVEVSLLPSGQGAAKLLADEMVLGAVAPLLQLPSSTAFALLLRGESEPKPGESGLSGALVRLFGERITSEQSGKLDQVLSAFAATRRGATVVGVVSSPAALVATFEVSDEQAFGSAFADALGLIELGPLRSWLGATFGAPSLQSLPNKGALGRARLRLSPVEGASSSLPRTLFVTWWVKGSVGYVTISAEEAAFPAALEAPTRLSDSRWLQATQPDLAQRTAFSAYVDTRILAPGGPDDAPLFLSLGRRGEQIIVAADLAPATLRAAATLLR